MSLQEADEIAAYQTSLKIYSYLKHHEEEVTEFQNLLLFVSKFKSTFFFLILNLLFLLFYSCHFSIFCYVLILISIRTIPIYYVKKIVSFILRLFSPSESEKLSSPALNLDHLSCLLSIIHQELCIFFRYIVETIKKAELFHLAFLSLIHFGIFYITYSIGDALCIWIAFHSLNLLPLILAKRIGFDLFNFPIKTEIKNLQNLQVQIEQERQVQIDEENRQKAEETLRQNEEVKRFAEIAKYNEEVERNILLKHSASSNEYNDRGSITDSNGINDVQITPTIPNANPT